MRYVPLLLSFLVVACTAAPPATPGSAPAPAAAPDVTLVPQAPIDLASSGDQIISSALMLQRGRRTITAQHAGVGVFKVVLKSSPDKVVQELFTATGQYKGTTNVDITENGAYYLSIAATGDWQITIR